MINDEFTNSKSNNDSHIGKSEFAHLPDSEFSDAGEMSLHRAAYDASLMKSQDSSSQASSTGIESSAVETTAASTSAATSIAATSAGIITVASTVAIGALGVFAVVSNVIHDYRVDIESVRVIGDSMSYSVAVYDQNMNEQDYEEYFNQRYNDMEQGRTSGEELTYPFVIKLYNNSYSSSRPGDYLYNEGVFEHITVGDTYTIEVSEDRFGGDILYQTSFVATYSYAINSFSFPVNVDLEYGTFDVYLDITDDADAYSDLTLYLYDLEVPEETNYTFNLEKITGFQTIVGPNSGLDIDVFKDWGYKFSFKENGEEVIYIEDVAHFEDMYGRKSGFNEFIFDKTYNYKEQTMDVQLDFDNDFGWYDNFVLTLYIHYGNENDPTSQPWTDDREIELDTTTDTQTLNIMELDINVRDEEATYTYVLNCDYRGSTIEVAKEDTAFILTDNSGAISQWNRLSFTKSANFFENTFEVQLDYVDDFYDYDDFVLTLFPNGVNAQYDFALISNTEIQTCTFDVQQHYLFSFDYEYTYQLTANYQGNPQTLEYDDTLFKFTDNSGFRAFEFNGQYNYGTGTFDVRLDYDDPNNYFSNFVMNIASEDTPEEPVANISLEKTTEVQSISMSNNELEVDTRYVYTITCDYKGNEVTVARSEQSFSFYDPDLVPDVSISFVNGQMNWGTGKIKIQLDYTDKYSMLNGVFLRFYGKANENQDDYFNESDDIWLDQTTDVQEVYIGNINTGEEDGIDYIHYNLAYNLYWEYYTETDTDTASLYDEYQSITLTNSAVTEFRGVESKFQIFKETDASASYEQKCMFINFDMIDENSFWSDYKVYWEGVNPEDGSTYQQAVLDVDVRVLAGWHKFSVQVGDENDELFNGEGWDLVITADVTNPYTGYEASDEEIYRVEDTKPVLVDAPDPEIFAIDFSESAMPAGNNNYSLTAFPLFAGDASQYTDVEILFEKEDGTVYTYAIDSFSDYFDFYVDIPSEGAIDIWNDFEYVPFTISVRYCTFINNVKSNPITKVLATDKAFYVSV